MRFSGVGRQSFADSSSWSVLVIICAITSLLATGDVHADNKYFDGGVKSTVFQADVGGGKTCANSGCHNATGANLTCTGTTSKQNWSDYDCAFDFKIGIASRISSNSMPDGGPFTSNPGFTTNLTTWKNAGYPKSPATATSLTATPGKNSATLGATFDTNTRSGGSYLLQYKLDTSGTYLDLLDEPRNLTSAAAINSGSTLQGLLCNRTYDYRAQAANGGGTSAFVTDSFDTTACTAPVISAISGTNPVAISEDNDPTAFALTLGAEDDDAGTLTWTLPVPPSHGSVGGVSGTGVSKELSYMPEADNSTNVTFTVRVRNGTTTKSTDFVVTVNITAVNDPPEITTTPNPLTLTAILEDSSVMHTLVANDVDGDDIFWSVNTPNHGTVTFPSPLVADTSKTFTYTPGKDANATGVYTVTVTAATQTHEIIVSVPIIAVNDSPVIGSIGAQAATEGVMLEVAQTVPEPDPDDPNDGTGNLTWSITKPDDWLALGMSISAEGVFSWTPTLGIAPTPGVFNDMYSVIIRVQDDTIGSTPDTEDFTVTVNPPDTDADMVADYNDYCPGASPSLTSTDSTNADFDNDGTRGTDVDPTDTVGGDVCDMDDDNDGMPDDFENTNSFDKFNALDGGQDADGDGVTNLQEYLDGTSPNQVNLAIDATGYLTPYDLVPPEPTSIHSLATAVAPQFSTLITPVSTDPNGPYRPGNNTIEWVPSNAINPDLRGVAGLVSDPPTQPFLIRPLVSFGVNQQVEENTAADVIVTVRLNGDSPSWMVVAPAVATPATVNYTVSGTASAADHNAVSGSVQFNPGEYSKDITFNTLTDGIVDPNETVVFTLTSATNAAIGVKKTHTVTIVEDNIAPRAALQFSQGGSAVAAIFDDSPITINAMPSDANAAQALSCNWSGTDNALMPPGIVADCKASPNWSVLVPVAGNYLVDVVVTDNGSPTKSTRVSRILHVAVPLAVMLSAAGDSDMDGTDDLAEGFADADGDGIPAYLDNIDGAVVGANLAPDQTVDMSKLLLLETEPGLTLRRGSTTQAANIFGALVSDSDIEQFGNPSGGSPVNSADSFEHVGGIYDFEIDGLIPGTSARIVIPLQSAIPRDARYRKFNPATGWSDFVVDANNLIASSSGELGACPEPGSSAYRSGLNYLDNCVQLTIQDGGLNDTDNTVNGVINDPATVGVELRDPEGFDEVEDGSGGGRMSPLLLTMLLVFGGFAFWRRRRGFSID